MKAYMWRDMVAARDKEARLRAGKPPEDVPEVKVGLVQSQIPKEPTVPTLSGPLPRPVCVDCAHYSAPTCNAPKARDPVTGRAVDAGWARKDRFSCGPAGHYFVRRPANPPRVRAARPHDHTEPMVYAPPSHVQVRRLEPFRDAQLVDLLAIARNQ